jgi:hypothetical protein
MEKSERENKRLKLGLTIRKFIDGNNVKLLEGINSKNQPKKIANTIRKLGTFSGIPNPSLVQIVNGQRNAAWTTFDAIVEGLDITFSEFAAVYDSITEKQISAYKTEIEEKKKQRQKTKVTQKKKGKNQ